MGAALTSAAKWALKRQKEILVKKTVITVDYDAAIRLAAPSERQPLPHRGTRISIDDRRRFKRATRKWLRLASGLAVLAAVERGSSAVSPTVNAGEGRVGGILPCWNTHTATVRVPLSHAGARVSGILDERGLINPAEFDSTRGGSDSSRKEPADVALTFGSEAGTRAVFGDGAAQWRHGTVRNYMATIGIEDLRENSTVTQEEMKPGGHTR